MLLNSRCEWLILATFAVVRHAPCTASTTYIQSGSCFDEFGIEISSCSDLDSVCASHSCSNLNGEISYTCFSPQYCQGSASPVQVAATEASGSASLSAGSNDCINGHNLKVTTCADTSSFRSIGCSCYTCIEENNYISLSCTAPFSCSNEFESASGDASEDAPSLKPGDYAVVCAVFIGAASLFAVFVWWICNEQPKKLSDLKQSASESILVLLKPRQLMRLAVKKVKAMVYSFFIEPNVRDDGTATSTLEFWASMNLWVALFRKMKCCCYCNMHRRQRPTNYKPPLRITQGVRGLVTDTCIMFSLAFVFGTLVSSDSCNTAINGNYCHQGTSVVSFSGTESTSNGQCTEVDTEKTIGAVILTTLLSKILVISFGYAEEKAQGYPHRKWVIHITGLVVRGTLVGFAFGYSFLLTTKASGSEAAKRRYTSIAIVLAPAWIVNQAASVIYVFVQRLGIVIVYTMPNVAKVPRVEPISTFVAQSVVPYPPDSADSSGVVLQVMNSDKPVQNDI